MNIYFASVSKWWIVISYVQVLAVKSNDHHRRHHHDVHLRHRGQQHHRSFHNGLEWDPSAMSSSSLDDNGGFSKSSSYLEPQSGDAFESSQMTGPERSQTTIEGQIGQLHRLNTLGSESKYDLDVADEPLEESILRTSGPSSNSSQGAKEEEEAPVGDRTYDDDQVYDSEGFDQSNPQSNVDSENVNKDPVPAASKARSEATFTNNDDINSNYISNSRWTLKYKGMPSEQELNNTRINITAKLGGSAFLPCRVGHLGDRQISWIRRRDWHVLTSGRILYTHDQRFSVLHEPGSQDWTLHIKWVNMRDAGAYECQVSTGTGIISLFVKLSVVVPEAYIPGDGQYHVDKGSAISLSCYIRNSPAPPQYILWHHNAELLNFLRDRPDIKISDDLHKRRNQFGFHYPLANGIDSGFTENMKGNEDMSISRLQVPFADDIHSGNYTCSAPNTQPASTLVFITEGDKTAAVQRIDSGAFHTSIEIGFIVMSLFISVLFLS